MGSINNGINYTIGFSDNFSQPLANFSGAVGKVATTTNSLSESLAILNPQLNQLKTALSSAKGMFLLEKRIKGLATSVSALNKAITGNFNARLAHMIQNLSSLERVSADTSININKTTTALEAQAAVTGQLATNLGAVKQGLAGVPNAKQFRHLARANATLQAEGAAPYVVGGTTTIAGGYGGSRGSSKNRFVPPIPITQRIGKTGQQLRNFGQGSFQSAMALGFMAYPFMGLGGKGVQYNRDIDNMVRDAKLRSPDVLNNKQIESSLRQYLEKTFRENPYNRDSGAEILSTLGAYGISFRGKSGGFEGSLAQKFLELNLKGVQGLDMSPSQLAKAQSYMIANAKQSGITTDEGLVDYVGDRMKYINYLADKFGVLEKDIARGQNEKIRAAVQGISPTFSMNADDDSAALSAWLQRATGRNQSKATSVGTSLLSRMSQMSYLVGTSKQAGLFNVQQAQDIRSVIANKGGLAGVEAFFRLRDANKRAVYDPFIQQGLGSYDKEGNFVRRQGLSERQQSAISKAELAFKAREKKTIGEYGDTIGMLGSVTNMRMLEQMLNPNKKELEAKGMDKVFKAMRDSLDGHIKRLDNSLTGLMAALSDALMPSLMVAMDSLSNIFNHITNFLEAHPLVAKGLGATALAGLGASVGLLGVGMVGNMVGSTMQGIGVLGSAAGFLAAKKFGLARKAVQSRKSMVGNLAAQGVGFPMVNMMGSSITKNPTIRAGAKGGLLGKLGGGTLGGIGTVLTTLVPSLGRLGAVLAGIHPYVAIATTAVIGLGFALSQLGGWQSVLTSTGQLLGNFVNLLTASFDAVGIAIQGLFLNIKHQLDKNPFTRGMMGDVDALGWRTSSTITDMNKGLGGAIQGLQGSNAYNRNKIIVRALGAKTNRSVQEESAYKQAVQDIKTYEGVKGISDPFNATKYSATPNKTQEGTLYKLNRSILVNKFQLLKDKALLFDAKTGGNFLGMRNTSSSTIKGLEASIQKREANDAYLKKQIEQIEAAKAQKEESIKQTKALSDNTTATKNLTDAIGKLGNLDLGTPRENYSRDKKGGSGAVTPFSNQKVSLGMPLFGF